MCIRDRPDVYSGGYKKVATYKSIMSEVESSLMNLNTDYIDFYFVHLSLIHISISRLGYFSSQPIISLALSMQRSRAQLEAGSL